MSPPPSYYRYFIRTILPYTSKPATIRTFVPSSTTNHITCTLSHVPCTAPQHSVKGQSSSRMIRVTVLWSARVCCRWRDQAGKGPHLMVTYVRLEPPPPPHPHSSSKIICNTVRQATKINKLLVDGTTILSTRSAIY